ncbi:uncharacterized protein TEOVI_000481600 [Trypanosoma equiperdum]|uniref:Uncharacterized protein n=2 Tax=Trypanozoon TaxID=39700 RepID=Q38D02_TRYB2|nr:hypothetical protein, unlikely [Trypanosoma brucei brucei TREU927]EAN77318.1 hypothetical protein, unlikely [Trypanosoma brucei brucei TREU927]SCU65624.1 hypothetical protein, conserved [Trypanosoma equiperdum]
MRTRYYTERNTANNEKKTLQERTSSRRREQRDKPLNLTEETTITATQQKITMTATALVSVSYFLHKDTLDDTPTKKAVTMNYRETESSGCDNAVRNFTNPTQIFSARSLKFATQCFLLVPLALHSIVWLNGCRPTRSNSVQVLFSA